MYLKDSNKGLKGLGNIPPKVRLVNRILALELDLWYKLLLV